MHRLVVSTFAFMLLGSAHAPAQELPARSVKFSANRLPLADALKQLQEQNGITLKDRRTTPANPVISIKAGTFWPTLDDLCVKAGIGYSPHGGVALVDTPNPKQHVAYSGIFRFAVNRITVFRDDEAQLNRCIVAIDAAWEPHFRAVYVNVESSETAFETPKGENRLKQGSLEKYKVANKTAERIEIPTPAPPRTTAKLNSLTGRLRVIGVTNTLDFAFAKVKADVTAVKDGVTVRIPIVKTEVVSKRTSRISVEVEIAHPEGALVAVDSFEEADLVNLNRVSLTWTDPRTSKTHMLSPTGRGAPKKSRTGVTYHFEARDDAPLPPPGVEPTLHVQTPARVAPFMVPFDFRDLPLP